MVFPSSRSLVQNNLDSINALKQLHLLGEGHLVAPVPRSNCCEHVLELPCLGLYRALTLAASGRF